MATTEPAAAGGVSVSRDELLEQADQAARTRSKIAELTETIYYELQALRLTIAAGLEPTVELREARPAVGEGWYGVELFGHRSRIGYVRTVVLGGREFVEVREPEHMRHLRDEDPETAPERVEYYAPAAIFSLDPSTEQAVLEHLNNRDAIPF